MPEYDSESAAYLELLNEANSTDLSLLEGTQAIKIVNPETEFTEEQEDKHGTVIAVIPQLGITELTKKRFKNTEADVQRLMFLLFIKLLHTTLSHDKYSIIYAHHSKMTTFSQRSIFNKAYKLLPYRYKKNLSKLYVVHHNYGLRITLEYFR